jgi:hypothetical protein
MYTVFLVASFCIPTIFLLLFVYFSCKCNKYGICEDDPLEHPQTGYTSADPAIWYKSETLSVKRKYNKKLRQLYIPRYIGRTRY